MTTDPIERLRFVLVLLVFVVLVGTVGYIHIEGIPPLDALYMTVITLATVGYREMKPPTVAGKIFTIGLIVAGVAILAWALETVAELVVSEQLTHSFRRRKMRKQIEQMKDHYIVCGHGRMGQQITRELKRRGLDFVVIEDNPEQHPLLESLGYPVVGGDATEDEVLLQAGVMRAKGLVTVGPTDAHNTFVTLSARGLNRNLYIVARSVKLEDEEKLRRAGADRVLSPYIIGGRRMAAALLHPTVVDFLDVVMHSEDLELEMDEVKVAENSRLAGRSLREIGLLGAGPVVVGVKAASGEMQPAPCPTCIVNAGDTLIALGTDEQIQLLRNQANPQKG